MCKMDNGIGNEGVKRLLASLPFTCLSSAAHLKALPPTPPLSQEMTLIVCVSLSSPVSLLLPVLSFHFPQPSLLLTSFFLPLCSALPPPVSVSLTLSPSYQPSSEAWRGAVCSEDNRRGAQSREMQGTETWGENRLKKD